MFSLKVFTRYDEKPGHKCQTTFFTLGIRPGNASGILGKSYVKTNGYSVMTKLSGLFGLSV